MMMGIYAEEKRRRAMKQLEERRTRREAGERNVDPVKIPHALLMEPPEAAPGPLIRVAYDAKLRRTCVSLITYGSLTPAELKKALRRLQAAWAGGEAPLNAMMRAAKPGRPPLLKPYDVVTKRDVEGLTYAQMAEEAALPAETLRSRYRRRKGKL